MVPLVTPVTETDGGVVSRLIPVTVPVAQLPAGSQDLPDVMTWLAPSADTVWAAAWSAARVDGRGSTLVQVMVTGALYQPFVLGARSGEPVTARRLTHDDRRLVEDEEDVPVTGDRGCSVKGRTSPLLRWIGEAWRVMPLGTTRVALPLASRAVPLLRCRAVPELPGMPGSGLMLLLPKLMVPLVTGLPLASRTDTVRVETGMDDVVGLVLVQGADGQGDTS